MAHIKPDFDSLDSWKKFTKRIYNEWDADPGYYALQHTDMPRNQRLRAAIAWCTYYNLGIAADASELSGDKFWEYLWSIFPTAKRATERRHFRGRQGTAAIEQWRRNWPRPEALAEYMCDGAKNYFQIRKRGSQVLQYGDYFYWKWCDLHEVLGFGPVDMTNSEKYSPQLPQQGAVLIYTTDKEGYVMTRPEEKETPSADWNNMVTDSYERIIAYGRAKDVPPRTTDLRPFDIQEAETVSCVYKQMANGSYVYGTRTAKAMNRLEAAGSKTARKMADTLMSLTPYSRQELHDALVSLKE